MGPAAIALFGCALLGASALAHTALQQSALVAAVAGAVIAELGGGKVGVAWNDPQAPTPTAARNVRTAAIAFTVGALTAGAALCLGVAVHRVRREMHGPPLLVPLALGLVESAFVAVQLEILHRGVVRVFCKATEPRSFVPIATGVAMAATAGVFGWQPVALLASGAFALAMALAWNRAGGALVPIGMHAGYRFVLSALASGSGLGFVGTGPAELGLVAPAASLLLAAGIAFWPRRSATE